MKFVFRKFRMMYVCLKQVKGDYYRTKETKEAIVYIFKHPSHLLKQKHVESNHNPVLKTVNAITNYPYFETFYKGAVENV